MSGSGQLWLFFEEGILLQKPTSGNASTPTKNGSVNACVILRRNNFDPLLIFSPRVTTYRVLRSVCSVTRANQRCAPHLRQVRLHLDTLWWTAGAETSEREVYRRATCARSSRLPSLPQASR